jgi:murein DD-endopeptidase MepM/ murein hydrolase activator NlpD
VASSQMSARRWPAQRALTTVLATAVVCLALGSSALAATGGAPTAVGGPPPPPSPTGEPVANPSAGELTLLSATAAPRKTFYYGFRYPKLQFVIGSTQSANDLRIDVLDSAGVVVKSFFRNDVAPNATNTIRWDGTAADGRPARNGHYRFQIVPQSTEDAAQQPPARPTPEANDQATRRSSSSSQTISLHFDFHAFAFPVLGPHDFGDAGARFGAARSGHTHEGQDVMADCGTPLVAARGGTVQHSGYQSAAGNYLVIDGRGTGLDFMYAHLAEPPALQTGERVRTGQPIGIVGQTGDATACHLHFEMWTTPGWYQGGSPIDPLQFLTRWDRYS